MPGGREEHRVTVTGFDHLVLGCTDVEASLAWYVDVLGLEPVRVDDWRAGAVPFPSVRIDPGTIIDLIEGDHQVGRLDHFCLVVDEVDPATMREAGVEVLEGPVPRFGARGTGQSIYIRDPDGTTIELRSYS